MVKFIQHLESDACCLCEKCKDEQATRLVETPSGDHKVCVYCEEILEDQAPVSHWDDPELPTGTRPSR